MQSTRAFTWPLGLPHGRKLPPYTGFRGPDPGLAGPYTGFGGPYPGFGGPYPGFGGPYPGCGGPYTGFAGPYPDFGGAYPGLGGPYQVLEVHLRVFEDQKYFYDLENDSQRSKVSFDHLNLDVWRSRKPMLRSKVIEI